MDEMLIISSGEITLASLLTLWTLKLLVNVGWNVGMSMLRYRGIHFLALNLDSTANGKRHFESFSVFSS